LRKLIPGEVVAVAMFVLAAVVFPEMLRQSVVSPADDPESTRMPARAALVAIGAATVLLRRGPLAFDADPPDERAVTLLHSHDPKLPRSPGAQLRSRAGEGALGTSYAV
jgi:hypothetical protein